MNMIEYILESNDKKHFVLFNFKKKTAPTYNGDRFETWATSPDKAFHQILFRLRRDIPSRYLNTVNENPEDYFVMDMEKYKDLVAKVNAPNLT